MPIPSEELMKRMALAFTRKMKGERPQVYRNGGIKPAGNFEMGNYPSSEPVNRDFFARNGKSMKMVDPDRIANNKWYANPEYKELYGLNRNTDPQDFRRILAERSSSTPNQYQREMAQREYDAQVGQQVARQISQMRQVSPNGMFQDPNFIQYQAKVIKHRIYKKNLNEFISGHYSARELANVEDYLKSVSDEEVVRKFPYFFDYDKDGGNYLMEQYWSQEMERMKAENPWMQGETLGWGYQESNPPAGTP